MTNKADKLIEQYKTVLRLMHEEAIKNNRAFFAYVYIRSNNDIENLDAIDANFTNNMHLCDSLPVIRYVEDLLLWDDE